MDGIAKAKDKGVKFGRKRDLTQDRVEEINAARVGRDGTGHNPSEPALVRRASTEP